MPFVFAQRSGQARSCRPYINVLASSPEVAFSPEVVFSPDVALSPEVASSAEVAPSPGLPPPHALNLLSVPFLSLAMFSRCLKITTAAMASDIRINSGLPPRIRTMPGISAAAMMEASET